MKLNNEYEPKPSPGLIARPSQREGALGSNWLLMKNPGLTTRFIQLMSHVCGGCRHGILPC